MYARQAHVTEIPYGVSVGDRRPRLGFTDSTTWQASLSGDWRNDGPRLPIEFARISKGKHLTLVLVPRRKLITTYWAESGCATLENAIENLRARESTPDVENIGYVSVDRGQRARFAIYVPRLRMWMKKRSLRAVIWTDLEANSQKETRKKLTPKAAVDYLKAQDDTVRGEAADYVRLAPSQTRTPLRPHLERELAIRTSRK
jgi:hypothetical protein